MNELIIQLTNLFDRLRQAGIPLGIEQYMLLMRALQLGHGLSDRAALERLCKLVWLVATTDEALFDFYFEAIIKLDWPLETGTPEIERQSEAVSGDEPASQQIEATAPLPEEIAPQPPDDQPTEASPPQSPQLEAPLEPLETEAPAPELEHPQAEAGPAQQAEDDLGLEAGEAVELAQRTEDEITNVRTVLHIAGRDDEISIRTYELTASYLPVSRRQMKQSWRYLRRMVREGPPVELDVGATIDLIGRQGFLVKPVMRPRRVNKAALLLLIDRNGSMVPFHSLALALMETASASGCFGRAEIYYFHNTPLQKRRRSPASGTDLYREHILFQKPQCVAPRPASEIVADLRQTHADVLVFSDAGAARGGWNEERIQNTAVFLYQLRTLGINQFAWLNPMPTDRWPDTSAQAIAGLIPMFSMNYRGLIQAIDVLRSSSRYTLAF